MLCHQRFSSFGHGGGGGCCFLGKVGTSFPPQYVSNFELSLSFLLNFLLNFTRYQVWSGARYLVRKYESETWESGEKLKSSVGCDGAGPGLAWRLAWPAACISKNGPLRTAKIRENTQRKHEHAKNTQQT